MLHHVLQEFFRSQLNQAEVNSGVNLPSEYAVIPFDTFNLRRWVGKNAHQWRQQLSVSGPAGVLCSILLSCSVSCTEWVFCYVPQGVPAGDRADQAPGGKACEEGPQGWADRHCGNSSACPQWTSATHRQHQAEAHILPFRLHRGWVRWVRSSSLA